MDNFFEILIYLIIIISFLSSLFRKKSKEIPKPPERRPETKRREMDFEVESTNKSQQTQPFESKESEYDILKEIENLFKPETERKQEPAAKPPLSGTKIEEKTRQKQLESSEWNEPTISEHLPTYSEHASTEIQKREQKKVIRKLPQVDSKVSEKAERFEKLLRRKEKPEDKLLKVVRERFSNPKTLKEYIVISEIIGKPKSLQ